MESALFIRRFNSLVPTDEEAQAVLGKVKMGESVTVEIKRARNPRQHRLYWALIGKLFEHQDTYTTQKQYSNAIKCAVGWCDTTELTNGKLMMVPKSISFANMPQSDFEPFFEKVLDLVTTKIWPNLAKEELRQEIEQMITPSIPA